MKKIFIPMMASAVLVACSTTQHTPLMHEEIMANVESSLKASPHLADEKKGDVRIIAYFDKDSTAKSEDDRYPASHLRLVRQSDSSKVVAAKTAVFLLSVLAGGQYQGSSKHDLKGSRLEVKNESMLKAYQPVRDYLFEKYGKQATGKNYFPLMVEGNRFYLIYEKYGQSQNEGRYELVQTITYRKLHEDTAKTKQSFKFECRQDGVFHTLTQWEADNYRLVREQALKNAQHCANRLIKEQGNQLEMAYERIAQ